MNFASPQTINTTNLMQLLLIYNGRKFSASETAAEHKIERKGKEKKLNRLKYGVT